MDPSGPHHLEQCDILIVDGVIENIGPDLKDKQAKVIEMNQAFVSKGWFDPSVSLGEPGFEERETLASGGQVAAQSGYTAIGIQPNTEPKTENKAAVNFIKSKEDMVDLYPIGGLTINALGADLCELYDMSSAGAIAFGDYKKPIEDPNLLKLALEYTQSFDGLVLSFPMDSKLGSGGMMNESTQNVSLGLKGLPKLAEHLQITRDLSILKYTGGRLHIPTISTAESVALIRAAKKDGLDVSCSVSIFNLCLTDDVMGDFNTNHKLMPPLREAKDVKALIKGLNDGTIDGVTSDHNPIDIEHKRVEFDHALFGSIGLEHTFGVLNSLINTESAIKALTGLKQRFGIDSPSIAVGNRADITIFNPEISESVNAESLRSKSKNSALLGLNTKGAALGTIRGSKQYWHEA